MMKPMMLCLLASSMLLAATHAFVIPASQSQPFTTPTRLFESSSTTTTKVETSNDRIDVVLFGIGDLRVDDHGGLQAALLQKESSTMILPLVVLDPTNLAQLPMVRSHAMDTAAMISSALTDLQQTLSKDLGLALHVATTTTTTTLDGTIQELKKQSSNVHIHVCDLDAVDNAMGYGPYSLLSPDEENVHAWTCHLREEPWGMSTLSDSYPKYEQKYQQSVPLQLAVETPREAIEGRQFDASSILGDAATTIPTPEQVLESILQATSNTAADAQARCVEEQGTGLYGTHWGGLSADTVGESSVWQAVQDYCIECQENDEKWSQHPNNSQSSCQRKATSLEHAAITWMLESNGSNNLIAGESMTRHLAAPLWLGTISPRRIAQITLATAPFYTSAVRRMVEGREWHKLLASKVQTNDDTLDYAYWRWHGFLCRYAKRDLTTDSKKKDALLLVHGFGASSTQWQRSIDALSEQQDEQESSSFDQILAPDLIGFGQCEKPALTYTQYLWNGFVSDFAKEVGVGKEAWDSYVVGGNSIGGYTSMSAAADDTVQVGEEGVVSSLGAPGSNKCSGLILFNSAGQIQTKEDIATMRQVAENGNLMTVAQLTANNGLPPCKPPPRPVARAFGNALLGYLRPNIESICKKVYPVNPDAADAELAKNILRDSLDPGAVNVMISGSKLPIPRTANELLGSDYGSARDASDGSIKEGIFTGPVLVAQGMLDPLNDAKGRAAMLGDLREGITVSAINGGHCPHDEVPQDCMRALLEWTEQRTGAATGSPVSVSN